LTKIIGDLLKSPVWLVVLLFGVILILFGSLEHTNIRGADISLDSASRYIVEAVGVILVVAGLIAAYFAVKSVADLHRRPAEKTNVNPVRQTTVAALQRLPIEQITLNPVEQITSGPHPRVQVSGRVRPAEKDIKVFVLREELAGRGRNVGLFSLSPGYGTTNDKGYWEHTVSLWVPGPFRIYAVVTTEEYEDLFRFYRRVFDAMLQERQKQDPDAESVPGWPRLDALPKTKKVASAEINI
jgi:hypothetical protein